MEEVATPVTQETGAHQAVPSSPRWRPWLAAALSLVFAGLGHLFARAYLRAGVFLVGNYFMYTISDYWPNAVLINIVCFILAAFDAFSIAKNGRGIF